MYKFKNLVKKYVKILSRVFALQHIVYIIHHILKFITFYLDILRDNTIYYNRNRKKIGIPDAKSDMSIKSKNIIIFDYVYLTHYGNILTVKIDTFF